MGKRLKWIAAFIAGWALVMTLNANDAAAKEYKKLMKWKQEDAVFTVTDNALSPVMIEMNKKRAAFRPFEGFGPIVELGGEVYTPAQGTVSLVSSDKGKNKLTAVYKLTIGADTVTYSIAYALDQGRLQMTVTSDDSRIRGVTPGMAADFGEWKQMNVTRYAELYAGQNWYAQPVYHVQGGFFVFADWDAATGNGTDYRYGPLGEVDRVDTGRSESGAGPIDLAPPVRYAANKDGSYLPLRETLSLGVSQSLWAAVPSPAAEPSPYMDELADKAYLDIWSGSVSHAQQLLRQLDLLTNGNAKLLTIYQPWGAKGWDATLPDQYDPSIGLYPSGGTMAQLRDWVEYARSFGFAGLRTNYVWMSDASPTYQAGRIQRARQLNGAEAWFVKPTQWSIVPQRQEHDMKRDFRPNASFSDQLASGGMSPAYIDFGGDDTSMRFAIAKERELIGQIKSINPGPFGSESSNAEFLIGSGYDYGEYGITNGHNRKKLIPDYKLRNLHTNAMLYGMGIPYRWFENPPWPLWGADQTFAYDKAFTAAMDDYRAVEILYGNGAYIGYLPNTPYSYMLTELLVVGQLQQYYANQAVDNVYYLHEGGWKTLEQLYEADDVTDDAYTRVKVVYRNGLHVYVNRSPDEMHVDAGNGTTLTLPQYGWAAFKTDGSVLAYSAYYPGTTHRVDFFRNSSLQYIDPRGETIAGVDRITLWEHGAVVMQYGDDRSVDTAADYSGRQGINHMDYESRDVSTGQYERLDEYDTESEIWSGPGVRIGRDWMEASADRRAVRTWIAPYTGLVRVYGHARTGDAHAGSAEVYVTRNGDTLGRTAASGEGAAFEQVVKVESGDSIRIELQQAEGSAGSVEVSATVRYMQDIGKMKLNVGGSYHIAQDGTLIFGDRIYDSQTFGLAPGAATGVAHTDRPIAGTDDDAIYQSQRYGNELVYQADGVPNGTYRVTLKLAETYFGGPNQRLMDIYMQDELADAGVDIAAEAGGSFVALDKHYIVEVTDGTLRIKLASHLGGATLAGIVLTPTYAADGKSWLADKGAWRQLDNGFASDSYGFGHLMTLVQHAYEDFSVQFKLRIDGDNGDASNWAGLVFGDYYVFVRNMGTVSLYNYKTGQLLNTVPIGSSPGAGEVGVKVTVADSTVRVYAGDPEVPAIVWTDASMGTTGISFIAWQTLAAFTDIRIEG